MIRLTAIILLICPAWQLATATTYHLPSHTTHVAWHFRVAPHPDHPSRWGIRWAMSDSLNYDFAEVTGDGISATDNTYGTMLLLTTGSCRHGVHTVLSTEKLYGKINLDRPGAGFSLRLTSHGGKTVLEAGSDRILFTTQPATGADSLHILESYINHGAEVIFDRLTYDSIPAPVMLDIDSVTDLLRKSHDPNEGMWTYFDRNTDPLLSRTGGKYTVATLRDPADGSYRVIYAGGAIEHAADWTPGRLKAILRPTLIPDVFDLTWLQPDGTPISDDTGATFDTHFLTLQFPRWKATIRFRRIPLSEQPVDRGATHK